MRDYLRIENNGRIHTEDLTLIGSSTKREDDGKIGMFGSGWKYALSWLLRNDLKPVIFSGTKKLEIDTNIIMHRDNPVNVITVNGIETSLTTQMGPKWNCWMAIREIVSNAIDEGGYKIERANEALPVDKENTAIYIPINSQVRDVIDKWDFYFAFDRKPLYENHRGKIYTKQDVGPVNIFRQGIRCYDDNKDILSTFDFNFSSISISEDRLTSRWMVKHETKYLLDECTDVKVYRALIKDPVNSIFKPPINDTYYTAAKSLIKDGFTFTTAELIRFFGDTENSILISKEKFSNLFKAGIVDMPFGAQISGEVFIEPIEGSRIDSDITFLLSEFIKEPFSVKYGKLSKQEMPAVFSNNTFLVNSELITDAPTGAASCLASIKGGPFKNLFTSYFKNQMP